jgi:PAS domain S-box-containing protein
MNGSSALTLALAEQMLAHSNDGLLAFDRDCRFLYWSRALEVLFGLEAADVVGQNAFSLFPFLVAIGEDACFRRALAGERVDSKERPFEVPGSNLHGFFEAEYGPLHDGQGAIVGGVAVVRDVTGRRQAELRLHETESRFRNMADVAPVMLWMSGTDGLCTFFNQTWLEFTGRSLQEEWGVGWSEGVHFEDFQRCIDTYMEAFNARRVFEMEYRLRRRDGAFRWILDRGTPRYAPDGGFAGFIGSCIDITERKQLEVDLRAAVFARDDFLSVASHELRTPLTSLKLQVDGLNRLLRRRPEGALTAERLGESLDMISKQTVRLGELVEALLDVSRLKAGRLELTPTEVDLGALAGEVIDRWRPIAERSGSRITIPLHDGVPNGAQAGQGPVVGWWDRVRLEQILNNLLANAVKYGPGHPIEVTVAGADGLARVTVRDRGIGIAPEDQERIFARFERAVPSSSYGGLGLGLWIVHQLLEAMGGSIQVHSAVGQGATFVVSLPAGVAQAGSLPAKAVQ